MSKYLFVYGTLMRKCPANEWSDFLNNNAVYLGEAITAGNLFKVADYPGLVKGAGLVYGELYLLEDPTYVFHYLDSYEDYFPENPASSLYLREMAEVVTIETGEKKMSWLYYYNQPTDHCFKYPDGKFIGK